MVRVWLECGQGMVRVWSEELGYGQGGQEVRVWPGRGQEVRLWSGCGQELRVWSGGQGGEQGWLLYTMQIKMLK